MGSLCLLGQGSLDDVTQGDAEVGEVIGVGAVVGQGGGQAVDDGVGNVLAVQLGDHSEVLEVLDTVADGLHTDGLNRAVQQHAVAVAIVAVGAVDRFDA